MLSTTADTHRVLLAGVRQNNNTRLTGLNNNDLIIGPTGSGKTQGYVIPNILEASESLIIADTKGDLRRKFSTKLKQKGYRVFDIDFTDLGKSAHGYNPLDFVHFDTKNQKYIEQDIMTIAAALSPVSTPKDPFWDQSAQLYLEALISYTLECLPRGERNLTSVGTLASYIGSPTLNAMFRELEDFAPNCFAVNRHHQMKMNCVADRAEACIKAFVFKTLNPMNFDGANALFTNFNRIEFSALGRQKTAVFLTISDTDRSMDALVNLFYTQALQELCRSADRDYPDCRLAVPVRFILDDFATNTFIPHFDRIISVIRSREISVSLILQSLTQLDGLYGHAASRTISGNCDTWIYLGGQDIDTARYIGAKLDKTTQTVLAMPLDQAALLIRGQKPQIVSKAKIQEEPPSPTEAELTMKGEYFDDDMPDFG